LTGIFAPFGPPWWTATLRAPAAGRAVPQHLVEVEGQTDILTMGIPFISPYNPESIMNPILVMCMGLGYLFNLYKGKPLVREGGVDPP
jgi:hypothetical protein